MAAVELAARSEDGQDFLKSLPDVLQVCWRVNGERQGHLLLFAFSFVAQVLARAGDSVALGVKKLLDAHDIFDVAAPVHALAGAAFHWLELRELRLPETQHVRRQTAKARDLADPEVKLLGDQNLARVVWFSVALFPGTHAVSEKRRHCAGRPEFLSQPFLA